MVVEGWRDGREVRGRAARLGAGKPEMRETDEEERERERTILLVRWLAVGTDTMLGIFLIWYR